MTSFRNILLAGGLGLAAALPAAAENYRFAMWQPETEAVTIGNRWFVEELAKATNGDITFELLSGGVLLPPRSVLQGVGDGVAEAGQTTGGYTPTELPLSNALQGYGFIENNPIAIGAAFADWVMHDPAAQKEWLGNNIVPLAGFSTPTYSLICNTSTPITEAEQIKGLKVRTFGLIGSLVTALGGVPVAIPSSEAYQALQTGQLDCAALGAGHLFVENKLVEVSKSTTLTNMSPAYNTPQFSFNRDFWKGLTTEQRTKIFELAARTHAKVQIQFNAAADTSLKESQARGHVVVEPAESLQKAMQAWVDAGVGDMAGLAKNTFKVEDPAALFASFDPYVKKWGELVRAMKDPTSEDEMTQLFFDNMYKDLDPATYGME